MFSTCPNGWVRFGDFGALDTDGDDSTVQYVIKLQKKILGK